MEEYDVLPSEPRNFKFSNVGTNIGLLHWQPPILHGDTVENYKVHIAESSAYPVATSIGRDTVKVTKQSPYVLENLKPSTSYIVSIFWFENVCEECKWNLFFQAYVEAVNRYGIGQMSSIAVFRTASQSIKGIKTRKDSTLSIYDQKSCCESSGVKADCLALCKYNASITQAMGLTMLCKEDFHRITKCQAAGRDHLPCCARRGVSTNCQSLCQGTQLTTYSSVYDDCITFIGNIMTCMEEGIIKLPEPVKNFHASFVGNTKATFSWDKYPGSKDNDTSKIVQFEIYYKEIGTNTSVVGAFEYERNINVTSTTDLVTISGLKPNTTHQFFVVARNKEGTSLPTSLVTLVTNETLWTGDLVKGKPSPPHQVTTATGADYISISWTAPTVSSPEDYHKYRLTYRPAKNASAQTSVETSSTSIRIQGLNANTQYILFITTILVKGSGNIESEPSETIVAWTEPIVGAVVERPKISPQSLVEGDNFTILCIGLGNPIPTVTLYMDGHTVHSKKTRHLVVTINNVSRYMRKVGCSAQNSENTDYKEADLLVKYKPLINSISQFTNSTGTERYSEHKVHTITCMVSARPPPTIRFGRNDGVDLRITMTNSEFGQDSDDDERSVQLYMRRPPANFTRDDVFEAVLRIADFNKDDAANYYCSAENDQGKTEKNFDVSHHFATPLPRYDVSIYKMLNAFNSLAFPFKLACKAFSSSRGNFYPLGVKFTHSRVK